MMVAPIIVLLTQLYMEPSRSAAAAAALSPSDPLHVFPDIIQRLRHYRAASSNDSNDESIDADEQGTVFSSVGLPDPSVAPRFTPKRAAVLICLFDGGGGELRVIITKRSSTLSTHAGEVALPGGKSDEGDADDVETAMREAKEEIGLESSLVSVITVLDPCLSWYLLKVVPVIGFLRDKHAFRPIPNPAEVETVFDVPLEMFLKDENRRSEEREWMGEKYLIHYFDFETEDNKFVIWGLTASILIRAASVVYQRSPSFIEQQPQFKYLGFVNGLVKGPRL